MLGLIAIAFSGTASAVDIYVNATGGNDNNDGLSWATAKATIKNATGSAADNDVIWLADGEYTGPDNRAVTIDKNLTITGQTTEGTIINLEGNPRLFTVTKDLKLSNLTIRNAYSTTTSGTIYIYNANLTIQNCLLLNNTSRFGGAIFADSSSRVTITNSTFTQNTANSYHGGAIGALFSTVTITNTTLINNTVNLYHGGAIYAQSSRVTITNSTLTNNTAPNLGGAIFADSSMVAIGNTTVTNNTAPNGGAIYAHFRSTVTITNSTLTNNTATNGGAIYIYLSCTLTMTNTTLTNNTANLAGAIIVRSCSQPAKIMFCRIFNNPDQTGLNVYADYSAVDARFNWWGSNNPDFSSLVSANVTYNPWIVLRINANPDTVLIGETSQITADLQHDSDGALHDPTEGIIPYKGLANFSTTFGSITDTNFTDGTATSTLTNLNTRGSATVYAKVDNETVNITVTVLQPATFALSNLTVTPTTGVAPLTITVKANITNTGDIPGDYTATLKINQKPIKNQTVTLNPGETKTIEFIKTLQPGTYNVTIDTLPPKLVTAVITINQLAGTANWVKKYYVLYKRLPSSVTISGKGFTMAQFLDLLVRATIQINAGNLKPLSPRTVGYAGSTGTSRSIKLSKSAYISTAITIRNFINTYKRAPRYATTGYGKIPFTRLVYIYSKTIGFYGTYKRLPNYVSI
ncbi:hypothetical protein L5462_07460 [Methanothermobacter sp. K4]|nr:hypothetical protein [Methanothermobacter sp. K4]